MPQTSNSITPNKLTVSDLISVGVFTALYFVLVTIATFTCALLPGVGNIVLPALAALISGSVYMLLAAKLQKFGGITIMGLVMGLFFFVSGHFVLSFAANIVCDLLADLIAARGKFRSKKLLLVSYVVFSYGLTGPILPLWFMKDAYIANLTARGKDAAYIDTLFAPINNGSFVAAMAAILVCAVLGGLFAILLFTVLPTVLVGGVNRLLPLGRWSKVILEAVLKVAIFLSYMVAISKMKEIHRVFEYHGAEHKTIACYEAGDALTVENVRKYTRFHPRCGTSFLILVVIVSVFLYSVLPWSSTGLRVVFKLLLLPVVMGISYELLKWCGRSDNLATRIIRQPGIWVQHLTVFEPDDSMIEVAIAAVTPVLPEDPEDGRW